jgi:LemA protein
LTRTEDRLSAARRFYNGNVMAYNTRILTAPSSIVANLFDFTAAEFFEANAAARTAPTVN